MTDYLPIILMVAVVTALTVWLVLKRRSMRSIEARVFAIKDKRTQPSGMQIWAEKGVEVNGLHIATIERGLERTFEKAHCRNYTRSLRFSDYIVAIVKGEPDSDGNPCYRLPAGPYAGTVYDKGGYILVAGQMIQADEDDGNIIAIPEHTDQFEHLALVAEFEAEHIVLAYNDGDEFERTKIHGAGTGHPIIPNCPGTPMIADQYHGGQICCGDMRHLSPVDRMIADTSPDPRSPEPRSFL